MGKLVQEACFLASEMLELLLRACKDSECEVRDATFKALKDLVKAVPSQATLEALLKAAGDSDRHVRIATSSALVELTKADPSYASKVLEALLKAAGDSRNDPHRYASHKVARMLGELAKSAPSQTMLKALLKAVEKYDGGVHEAVTCGLGALVKVDPSQATLGALLKAAGDSDRHVRIATS
ncbi:MAG: HEAT repeat domain-containing protein, partial [Bacteroidota bacterium]